MRIYCRPGEDFMNIANLLFGSNFKILLSCDRISNMADMVTGVLCATLHCNT